jgi:hypothetical protein
MVRQLAFSQDQSILCSSGEDGHVYTFNLLTSPGSRIEDLSHVLKSCRFTSVMMSQNKNSVVAAGSAQWRHWHSFTLKLVALAHYACAFARVWHRFRVEVLFLLCDAYLNLYRCLLFASRQAVMPVG